MRRVLAVPALCACLLLACKGADPQAGGEGEAGSASQDPALDLPAVALPDSPVRRGDANLWITADAIWVASNDGEAERVVELASLSDGSPELIEALAEALDRLTQERLREPTAVLMVGVVGFELVLQADARTTVDVLRRVLTTARATGYRSIRYAAAEGSVELDAAEPVQQERRRFDWAPLVGGRAGGSSEDGLTLNGRSVTREALVTTLERVLRDASERCIMLELEPTTAYADWLALVAELSAAGVECVTVPSPAAPADVSGMPPLWLAPDLEDLDAAPREDSPSTAPEADPAVARVEHWWARVNAQVDARRRASCESHLTPLRQIPEAELSLEQLQGLTNLERNCGDPARVDALLALRTERFPDAWEGWYVLAVHRFEPLHPDPESGLSYRQELDPAERKQIATQVLAALDRAIALAPDQRDPRTWAAMAHTQLALAWEAEPGELAQRHARVERMRAWKLCAASYPDCPPAPSTDEQFTADLAALGLDPSGE